MGAVSALSLIFSLYSFKYGRNSRYPYYFWSVNPGSGSNPSFTNSDLNVYYGNYPPSSNPCAYPSIYKCVIGFTVGQLSGIGNNTKLRTFFGFTIPQEPQTVPYSRDTEQNDRLIIKLNFSLFKSFLVVFNPFQIFSKRSIFF